MRSAGGTPTAGVRVYAQQARDRTDANSPAAPLEGLTQTDAYGRYRLEIPEGRYYIASGSVSAPTYYPGETDLSAARMVTVTAGGVVEGIDFAGFVAASRGISSSALLLPPPPGTLSGVVRYPDGRPAVGVRVVAYTAASAVPPGTPVVMPGSQVWPAVTDAAGRYRMAIAPNTYQIVTGFAETPAYYTGDRNSTTPKSIVLASLATIDALDIELPFPRSRVGTTVRGRVTTKDGEPAAGSAVRIARQPPPAYVVSGVYLPSENDVPEARVARDGTFEFSNVAPGPYNAQAFIGSVYQYQSFEVGSMPVTDLQFSLPTIALSGQVLLEDGTPAPDVELFGGGVLTTADNPNVILSRVMRISTSGTFADADVKGLLEHNEYRFHFLNNPTEYEIRSVTAGTLSLLTDTLRVDGSRSIFVEARIAPRKGSVPAGLIKVTGTSFDSTSNVPSNSTRIYLCCAGQGNAERFSAPLRADGSFEFAGIPPGQYTVELQVKTGQLWVVGATIEAKSDGVKLQLLSTTARTLAPMVTIEIPNRP